jgi:hypothetical protein
MSGPSDKIAEAIMMLMQQGGRRGMPMEASPELQAYLRQVQGSTPNAESFDSPNVDLMPGSPMGEFIPEHPTPIGQDPWFDQELPPVDFEVSEPVGDLSMNAMDAQRAEELRAFMRHMGATGPGTNSSGGTWYVKFRGPNGKASRAEGPFKTELEAHRARQAYAKSTGRDPSKFIVEQDGV